VTLVFSLGPLGRAHEIPVAALLRGDTESSRAGPLRYRIAAACAMLALVATVFFSASDKKLAGVFIASVLAAYLLLRGVAALVMRAARSLPARATQGCASRKATSAAPAASRQRWCSPSA